jgi:hypothetical protein
LLGVVAAALGVGGPAAGAAVVEREHYSETERYSFDDCGFTALISRIAAASAR